MLTGDALELKPPPASVPPNNDNDDGSAVDGSISAEVILAKRPSKLSAST